MNIKDLLATEQRSAIERWCRDRARTVAMQDGRTLARVLGEHIMVLDLKDHEIAPHIALDGFWELWLSMCLAKRLKPGWKCIDVGANAGYFTLLMALITGAEVEAWEPDRAFAENIRLMSGMNGIGERVEVRNAAATATKSKNTLFYQVGKHGSASLLPMPGYDYTESVEGLPLADTTLDRVDFIKIDVEGSEPEVWEGMAAILDRSEPQAMLMEWTPKKYSNAGLFLRRIRERGFTVSLIDGNGNLQHADTGIIELDGHTDLWLARA